MKIVVDSDEYKCWHEVGHATVCLHFGGDVDFIDFLDGDARGHARTRCESKPGTERSVACGGFAAEVYLLKKGYAVPAPGDKRDINQVVLNNASMDGHAFFGRDHSSDGFEEVETEEFMNHAIGPDGWGGVVPIFELYFSGMQELARELPKHSEGRRLAREGSLAAGNSPLSLRLRERPLPADWGRMALTNICCSWLLVRKTDFQ